MAALLMATQILFGGFFIVSQDISPTLQWLFEIQYLKHSLDGIGALVLGFDRPKMNCRELYCHFQSPEKFMKFVGLHENLPKVFFAISATLVVVHLATYCIMRFRLKN